MMHAMPCNAMSFLSHIPQVQGFYLLLTHTTPDINAISVALSVCLAAEFVRMPDAVRMRRPLWFCRSNPCCALGNSWQLLATLLPCTLVPQALAQSWLVQVHPLESDVTGTIATQIVLHCYSYPHPMSCCLATLFGSLQAVGQLKGGCWWLGGRNASWKKDTPRLVANGQAPVA